MTVSVAELENRDAQFEAVRNEFETVVNSDAWKIAVRLGKIRIPFKKQIKKVLIKFMK